MPDPTLDELLARWAAAYQLSEADVRSVRDTVLRSDRTDASELDADWLWGLMRPVTKLLDGPRPLYDTLMRGYA